AGVAARELRLIGDAAMRNAIRKAGVGGLTAKMEVGLARVPHRPLADAVVELEQTGFVCDLGARLGRNQAARWRGRDRRLLLARTLANEPTGADRAILDFASGTRLMRRGMRGTGRGARSRRGGGGLRRFGSGRSGFRHSRRRGRLLGILLLAGLDRRRTLFEAEAVSLADHRVAADPAEL